MISEEQKQKNLHLFFKKLNDVGVNTDKLSSIYGDRLLNATYSMQSDTNLAYDGSLLHTLLRTLTPLAININGLLNDDKIIEVNTIVKICLLHQVSKCTMFEPNTNDWEIKNKGLIYKYAKYDAALKMGARSIAMCSECGIELTPIEVEAMMVLERDDEQAKYFSNTLSIIVKQANELTNIQTK